MSYPKGHAFLPPVFLPVRRTHHQHLGEEADGGCAVCQLRLDAAVAAAGGGGQQARMHRADSRSTRSGTSNPRAWVTCSSAQYHSRIFGRIAAPAQRLQPRIDDGPAAVCLLYCTPTHLFRTGAVLQCTTHGAGLSTALRAPRCRASVLRQPPSFCPSQLIFRDIHLPRLRRITRRGASEERPGHPDRLRSIPSCRGCSAAVASAYSLPAVSETRRTKSEYGQFSYASQDRRYTAVPPGLQPWEIGSKYLTLPASVLARAQSHPHGLSHAPNYDGCPIPSHPCRPRFPPRLAGWLT